MRKAEMNIETIVLNKMTGAYINWDDISNNIHKTDMNFVREFKDNINWNNVLWKPQTEEKLIYLLDGFISGVIKIKNSDRVWQVISEYQVLSEYFMIRYWNYLDKDLISKHQIMSEQFILDRIDLIPHDNIAIYQKLTPTLINHLNCRLVDLDVILAYRKMHDDIMNIIHENDSKFSKTKRKGVKQKLKQNLQNHIQLKLKKMNTKL